MQDEQDLDDGLSLPSAAAALLVPKYVGRLSKYLLTYVKDEASKTFGGHVFHEQDLGVVSTSVFRCHIYTLCCCCLVTHTQHSSSRQQQ